jgi:hypothetical protein
MAYRPTDTPGRVFLAADPDTPIDVTHIGIVGDGNVHVTTTDESGTPTLTVYDPADIDHIDFQTA